MNSFKVLRAAAFRGLKPRLFDAVIPLELIEAVKNKYGFTKAPGPNEPLDFQLGKLPEGNRVITVEQFVLTFLTQVTSLGAATRTSTDDADFFLEHLIEWASKEFSLDSTRPFPPAYHSQVEFSFDKPLSSRFEEVRGIGRAITNIVKGYGLKQCPEFEFGGFSMHFDPDEPALPKPVPTPFAIERRVGSPYEENKYFSQAPLKTQDHKAILEQLEKILLV
jgi:hypothetical protein